MKIQCDPSGESLEKLRPAGRIAWQLVISGDWSEDMCHGGHVAYYLANTGPGVWMLEAVERNTCLDVVTQEDVDAGRLNDDQTQAMWGETLEEAQAAEWRAVVAVATEVSAATNAVEMARILYDAVCDADGKQVNEPDGSGLVPLAGR